MHTSVRPTPRRSTRHPSTLRTAGTAARGRRPVAALRSLVAAVALATAGTLLAGVPAQAATGSAPIGSLDRVTAGATGIRVQGWALDRDTSAPVRVHVYVDGTPVGVVARGVRRDVGAAFGHGDERGFNRFLRAGVGRHTVCVHALDDRGGRNPLLGCRTVTVTDNPPIGSVDEVTATTGGVRVSGWAVDPDSAASLTVRVDVDGAVTAGAADLARPDVAAVLGRGERHGFSRVVPAAAGPRAVCVSAVDPRTGAAARLACRTVTVPGATSPSASTGTAPAAGTTSGRRSAWLHPFSSTSAWNTAIGSRAAFESRTGTRTASFLTAKPVINRAQWSVATRLATAADPLVTLTAVRNKATYRIRIPADTVATGGLDRHVTVVQPDGVTAYDLYKISRVSATQWRAEFVVVVDLRSPGTAAGVRASGQPGFAGLIRRHEVAARHIPHAVAIAVPGSVLRRGPVWPATREDGDAARSYTGRVPMGALFAIPPGVDVEAMRLSPEGRALARALQRYGAYVVDRSDMASLYCELSCDGAATERMKADFRALFGQLRAVTNNGARSVGGGGTPRVAAPAPL